MTKGVSFKEAYEAGEKSLRGLGVRLDACDRAILQVSNRVDTLEREYAEMRNELSLLASVQRTLIEHEARIENLEAEEKPMLSGVDQSPHAFVPFGSIDKLVQQVEKMFECKNGDYHQEHSAWNESIGDFDLFPYVTLSLMASSAMGDAQERLRQSLYTAFVKLETTCKFDKPVLYWRYGVEGRIREEAERGPPGHTLRHKIRTRIAIPEADFSVVGDMVHQDGGLIATLLIG